MSRSAFSQQAKQYVTHRPTYPESLIQYLVSLAKDRQSVWDCATGNGQLACLLAPYFKEVQATDISEEQLRNARLHDRIVYSQSEAEKTNFKSNYFDLITVAQAVHWFNFGKFYAEVDRLAKPNAILALIGYGQLQVNSPINRVMEEFYWDMFGQFFTENRQFVEKRYETIPFPYHEIETPDFSIDLKWSLSDLHGYLRTWSPVVKYMTDYRKDPTESVIKRLEKLWGAQQQVRFPVFLRVGRVIK